MKIITNKIMDFENFSLVKKSRFEIANMALRNKY